MTENQKGSGSWLNGFPAKKILKFGGGDMKMVSSEIEIPCDLVGKQMLIKVGVVDSDILLLLSKDIKKPKRKLNAGK